jgi:hypothetical protein
MRKFSCTVIVFSGNYRPMKYHNVSNLYKLHCWLLSHHYEPTAYNCYFPDGRFFRQFRPASEYLPYYFLP